MLKKYCKLFIFILTMALISILPVSAKKMTLEELGKIIEEDYNGVAAYVIGDYVFTSEYTLTTRDIMLASRSIKVEDVNGHLNTDAIYDEMNIYEISKVWVGETATWEAKSKNFVGTQPFDESKLDVRYIDYDLITEKTRIEISLDKTNEGNYKNVLDSYHFSGNALNSRNLVLNDKLLSGLLLKNNEAGNVFPIEEQTGYYFAFVVNIPKANNAATVTIKGDKKTKTIKYEDFEEKTPNEEGFVILYSFDPQSTTKTITITADLDGEGSEYSEEEYVLDYSALTIPESTKTTFTNVIPSEDSDALLNEKGYTKNPLDNYEIVLNDGVHIDLTGSIYKQTIKDEAFGINNKTGWYLVINMVPEGLNDKTTFEVPCAVNSDTCVNNKMTIKGVQNSLSLLVMLNKNASSKEFTITIDRDGEEENYAPTSYTFNYEGITFKDYSTFSINKVEKDTDSYNKLQEAYGWNMPNGYQTDFNVDGENVKISGLIPKTTLTKNDIFSYEDATSYYLGYVLNLGINASDKTTITTKGNGEEKTLTGLNFVKGEENYLYVLKHLHLNDTSRNFEIIVDLDGEGEEYEPSKIVVNWEDLYLNVDSLKNKVAVASDKVTSGNDGYINEDTKQDLNDYLYQFDKTNVTLDNYTLTGSVKKQTLEGNVFNDATGYYVPLNIYFKTLEALNNNYAGLENYGASWTLSLRNEDGSWKNVPITEEDYHNGYVTVLFKIYEDGHPTSHEKAIEYQIDFDGKEGRFNPITVKIDYQDVEFHDIRTVTFKHFNDVLGHKDVYEGESIGDFSDITLPEVSYHQFLSWKDEDGNVLTKETKITEDMTVRPYWQVDFDEFVNDLIEDSNTDASLNQYLTMRKNDHTITFDIMHSSTDIAKLANIKLYAAMAESLVYGELTELTLSSNGSEDVIFTKGDKELEALKKEINDAIIKLVQSKSEDSSLLNDIVDKNLTFTIKITGYDNSVIEFTGDTTYTFDFALRLNEIQDVRNESELNNAIKDRIDVINIADSFTINNPINIDYDAIINGNDNTITLNTEKDNIINVTNNANVTINHLNLASNVAGQDTIDAIQVTSGSLTIEHVSLPDNTKAILVKAGAHISASNITYDSETYDNPLIRGEKATDSQNEASIVLMDKGNKPSGPKVYENVILYEDAIQNSEKYPNAKNNFSDILEEVADYQYYHYYLDSTHASKWVKITYHSNRGITGFAGSFTRYYDKTSNKSAIDAPTEFPIAKYTNDYYDYIVSKWCDYNGSNCMAAGEVKPTEDRILYPQYTQTDREGVKSVKDVSELQQALEDDTIHTIVILENESSNNVLNVGDLTIDRKVKINGLDPKYLGSKYDERRNRAAKLVGKITITAPGVSFINLHVEGDVTENAENNNVITLESGATSFTLSNSIVSAKAGNWNSGLYIKANNASTYVGDFTHFNGENLKSLIEIAGEVDSKTNILNSVFNGSSTTKSHIIIHNIKAGEIISLKQNEHHYQNNEDSYALMLDAEAVATNKTLTFANNWLYETSNKAYKIGIVVTDDKKDASGYTLKYSASASVSIKYLYNDTVANENTHGNEVKIEH